MCIARQSCGLAPWPGTAAVLTRDWLSALLPHNGTPGGKLGATLSQARGWDAVSEKSSEPSSEAWGPLSGWACVGDSGSERGPRLELEHSLLLQGFGVGATTPWW